MKPPSDSSAHESPVRNRNELEAYFEQSCQAPPQWRVGIEYETPAVDARTGEAVPYEGPGGIKAILSVLKSHGNWAEVEERGQLIGLRKESASITLEPGGQVEMSGRPCRDLHECRAELAQHCQGLAAAERELGVCFLGIGMTPATPLQRMPWMPKQRYRIMREIMAKTGRLGHRMMQQTATVQVNLDYKDEADARAKFRVSMALAPVLVGLTANSPIADGRPTSYKSFRAHVWTDTDPARCGILPFAFDTEALFHAYTEYALDVPMYFIIRNGDYIEVEGIPFRRYLATGFGPYRATLEDWANHLATLFPETRLKTYIEIRSPDSQRASLVLAPPAFVKGILYEDDCLEAAWDVLRSWTLDQRRQAFEDAARYGLAARVGRHRLADYVRELLDIATEGLRRQARADGSGRDERIYLEPLAEIASTGRCPADLLPADASDRRRLLAAARFLDQPPESPKT